MIKLFPLPPQFLCHPIPTLRGVVEKSHGILRIDRFDSTTHLFFLFYTSIDRSSILYIKRLISINFLKASSFVIVSLS